MSSGKFRNALYFKANIKYITNLIIRDCYFLSHKINVGCMLFPENIKLIECSIDRIF